MNINLPRVDDLLYTFTKDRAQDGTAIIHNDKKYTYGDMQEGMLDVASVLIANNLFMNERVIVHMGNTPQAVMAMFGILYTGNTIVPVAANIKPHRLEEIINDSGAVAIFTNNKLEGVLNELGDTPTLKAVFNFNTMDLCLGEVLRSNPGYPAALMYTSGTTGKPKGVICPHHKMMAAVDCINDYLFHTRFDVVATALPLSHGYGLYQIFTVFAAGGTVLLEENFNYPARTLERIKKYEATAFAAVPSMIHMIMQIEWWEKYLMDLEYITTAGAALPPVTFEDLYDKLKGEIIQMYGQTECVRALYYNPFKNGNIPLRSKSCGTEIPDTRCVLDEGENHVLDDEIIHVGELIVDSDHVMDGYWNDPISTMKTFKDGRLHTGDIFGVDDLGYYYYIGRKDEVIKINGERTSPQELDNALLEMPEIDEAASFVIESKVSGYRFAAYVVSKNYTITKQDVMRYCRRNLEAYLMPQDVVIVDSIQKTDNGKISRRILQKMYSQDN